MSPETVSKYYVLEADMAHELKSCKSNFWIGMALVPLNISIAIWFLDGWARLPMGIGLGFILYSLRNSYRNIGEVKRLLEKHRSFKYLLP